MITYLQHRGYRRKRLGSSRFDEESIPTTEGTAYASGVASSGAILIDLVNMMLDFISLLSVLSLVVPS